MATLPLYLGGFLGPFGTMMVISIYPELREAFDASTQAVNWAFSGYMIPFALLLTVSGTIGERYGRKRVIRTTFVIYAIASVLCVVAPSLPIFIIGRLLQGGANAFFTPLLIAGLSEVIHPSRLGRAVGVYTSFQAIGGAAAPFAGGVAAAFNWRIAFAAIAIVGLVLATRAPEGEPRPAASAPPIKPLLTPRMMVLWLAALTAAAGPAGLPMIVGLYLRDELFISSTATGFILLFGGIGGAIVIVASEALIKLKIDDVVGAIPVHLCAGIWGTLAVPITNSDATFGAQIYGIICVTVFVFVTSLIIWKIMAEKVGIRISDEAQRKGTDVSEIGVVAYSIRD